LACYEGALHGRGLPQGEPRAAAAREARRRAAALLKRLGRGAEAVAHWEALLAAARMGAGPVDVRPYEDLARYCEHALHDRAAAAIYVAEALAALAAAEPRDGGRARARLLHRLARLERGGPSQAAVSACG
jgi:hypothetical protein